MSHWEKDEMGYWETKYSFENPIIKPGYRLFERENFLLRWIKNNIEGKSLMEIGCYFPFEVIIALNPSKYKYDYVGVDVARDALRTAKKYLPEGAFVRCSAMNLPFKEESFDTILSLGVLHHLPSGTDSINQLSTYLRREGLFALTEPVKRRTLTSMFNRLRPESDSPHESRLNPQQLIHVCMKSGKILHFSKDNSIVLGLFLLPINFFPVLQESKTYLRFILAIDQLAIKTLGRIGSLFDAGAYFIVWKKN
jgi:SAM-dependent methyltransferase